MRARMRVRVNEGWSSDEGEGSDEGSGSVSGEDYNRMLLPRSLIGRNIHGF